MKKALIITFIVAVAIILFILFAPLLISTFVLNPDNLCGIEIIKEISTKDDKYKIIVYTLDCGATASASHNVSVLDREDELEKEPGNIFVCLHPGLINIELKNDTITIRHKSREENIYKKENSILGFNIIYEQP